MEVLDYVAYPLLASILIATTLHILGHTSRNHTNFILVALRILVASMLTRFLVNSLGKSSTSREGGLPDQVDAVVSDWPEDIRTAMRIFDLDPTLLEHVCCTRCFSLYGPFNEGTTNYDDVPMFCTFQETPSSDPCGAHLLQQHGREFRPCSQYFFQPLASWLSWFMSQPNVVRSLHRVVSGMSESSSGRMDDIWDGELLCSLAGPDGRPFFELPPQSSELCLAFSLFIDWFNPYGNKQAGKHTSVGAIYMICHNLPIQLHYRIENVYLAGIIPGPNEPSQHHLNHLLCPLVDELLKFWVPGVQLMRTASSTFGTLLHFVIAPLVCDLPAMRKTAGFAGHGTRLGRLCSFCLQDASNISSTDVKSWKRRTWQEHLAIAHLWNTTVNETIQNSIWKEYGIRWSELVRLPYWDPTRFTVVDTMHNFFLGDLQHHCRATLGMDADATPPEDACIQPHDTEEQQRQLEYGIAAIRAADPASLNRLQQGYIVSLAQANNVVPDIRVETSTLKRSCKSDYQVGKEKYTNALITWVTVLL